MPRVQDVGWQAQGDPGREEATGTQAKAQKCREEHPQS